MSDAPRIHIPQRGRVICPLCGKPMKYKMHNGRGVYYCNRVLCHVAIFADDPVLNHWHDVAREAKPDCTVCHRKCKLFFNSAKFMVWVCSHCKIRWATDMDPQTKECMDVPRPE